MAEPAVTSLTPAPTQTITAPSTFSLPPGPPQFDAIDACQFASQAPERQFLLMGRLRQPVDVAARERLAFGLQALKQLRQCSGGRVARPVTG